MNIFPNKFIGCQYFRFLNVNVSKVFVASDENIHIFNYGRIEHWIIHFIPNFKYRLMTRYSKEFKDNIIKQMMPPANKSVNQLAAETGVSEHTLYAWKRAAKSAGIAAPAGESSSERWSSEDKFLIVLETVTMNQAELESTFYRVLREENMQHHRGRTSKPQTRPISTHKATGPNQVWMWDITWLPSGVKGFYYYLYLILDLYSRKIVGWEIWPEESAENASILVKKAVLSEGCLHRTQPLILHSDNGSPMKGAALLETLYKLGVATSRSRPRVSNDNAYAESIFRTVKYRPDYPYKGFSDIGKAREWVLNFTRFYNYEHRHSGLNQLTPVQRHSGISEQIFANRIAVYQAARDKNPNRWSRHIRDWSLPDVVWLNPERSEILMLDSLEEA